MRVTEDKIEGKPAHAFTRGELAACLTRLPREWSEDIGHVRLMASLKYAETFGIAHYSVVTKKLVVYSRGRTKREVLDAIVRTLYLHSTRQHVTRISDKEQSAIDKKLAPISRALEEESNQIITARRASRVADR